MCDYKKMLIASSIGAVVFFAIHSISAMLTLDYYKDPAYSGLWSKLMMPAAGAPPMEFTLVSLAVAFVSMALFSWGYEIVHKSIPFKGWKKGAYYGLFLFAVAGVPSFLMQFMLFNIPAGLYPWWAVLDGLVGYLAAGKIIWKVYG